jgi:hypothetical protein
MRTKSIKISPSGYQYRKIREKGAQMKIEDDPRCRSIVVKDILNKVFSGELSLKDGKNYFEDVL